MVKVDVGFVSVFLGTFLQLASLARLWVFDDVYLRAGEPFAFEVLLDVWIGGAFVTGKAHRGECVERFGGIIFAAALGVQTTASMRIFEKARAGAYSRWGRDSRRTFREREEILMRIVEHLRNLYHRSGIFFCCGETHWNSGFMCSLV